MNPANKRFWKDKPILITGGTGFVGSNLAKTLNNFGAKIFLISRSSNKPLIFKGLKNIHFKNGNIEDFDFLNKFIKKNNIKIIFHLAAQPIVEIGHLSPLSTFNTNIKGTWNILESARQNSPQKIIIVSSVHVYGDNPNLPFKEEFYPQPSRPYETSKAAADLLAQSYADTYGLPVEIPRFVNLYGPGDTNFSRLIPKVIKDVLENRHPKVWDLGSVRDFLFINDALSAFIALSEKKIPAKKRTRVTNFGSGLPINIVELVKKIIEISENPNIKLKIQKIPSERKKEIQKQYVSISKAKQEFQWEPQINLKEGLKQTIKWYKDNFHLFNL